MAKILSGLTLVLSFGFVLLFPFGAQAQKKLADYLFHKVIEGKPLPVTRLGPEPTLFTEGFALYREGNGGYDQFRKIVCDLGVTEIYVLSGNGQLESAYNEKLAQEDASLPCIHGNKQQGLTVKYG